MLETLGIVQLRVPQDHPSHCISDILFRRLAGRSVLEWIVRRVTDAQQLDGVIALTDDPSTHRAIAAAIPPDVPVHLSQASDDLERAVEAVEEYPCRAVVLLSIDTPFVDPALIDRLVITAHAHPECDYISYRQRDGRPSVMSPVGVFAQWCTTRALKESHRKADSPADRVSATHYIYSHPEHFRLRLLSVPDALDRHDLRLRISCEEDWEHAAMIADALGEESLEWQSVAGLLDNQPAIRQQMARLNSIAQTADS